MGHKQTTLSLVAVNAIVGRSRYRGRLNQTLEPTDLDITNSESPALVLISRGQYNEFI